MIKFNQSIPITMFEAYQAGAQRMDAQTTAIQNKDARVLCPAFGESKEWRRLMIYFQYDACWQATFVEYEGTRLRLLDSEESGKANGLPEILKDIKSTEGRVGHGTLPYSDEVWDALLSIRGLQRKP